MPETATELNAEWLWTIIHSPSNDYKAITWRIQVEWQQNQAYEILARAGEIWSEDTSVFAYYILKSVLAKDIGGFLLDWLDGTATGEDWCDKWVSVKDSYYEKAKKFRAGEKKTISMRMTNPALDSNSKDLPAVGGTRKTRKFAFPRKYSRMYCIKTPCSKMGFTQRASCRPYKNCYGK